MKSVLCGFVFCNGEKDFSIWECKLPDEIVKQINDLVIGHFIDGDGSLTSHAYNKKLSQCVAEDY